VRLAGVEEPLVGRRAEEDMVVPDFPDGLLATVIDFTNLFGQPRPLAGRLIVEPLRPPYEAGRAGDTRFFVGYSGGGKAKNGGREDDKLPVA